MRPLDREAAWHKLLDKPYFKPFKIFYDILYILLLRPCCHNQSRATFICGHAVMLSRGHAATK